MQSIEIVAEGLRSILPSQSGRAARAVWLEVATCGAVIDLCREAGLALNSNGKPYVTISLTDVGPEDRGFAQIEAAAGTFKPCTRHLGATLAAMFVPMCPILEYPEAGSTLEADLPALTARVIVKVGASVAGANR